MADNSDLQIWQDDVAEQLEMAWNSKRVLAEWVERLVAQGAPYALIKEMVDTQTLQEEVYRRLEGLKPFFPE